MKNYIQAGNTLTVTAQANVTSGDGVLVGSLFGVAATDAASGADVEISTVGVYELPKVTTEIFAVGDAVYWDAVAKLVTSDNTKPFIGAATTAAGNPSAAVAVRLST